MPHKLERSGVKILQREKETKGDKLCAMLLQTELLWAAARIKKGTHLRHRTGRPEASTAT